MPAKKTSFKVITFNDRSGDINDLRPHSIIRIYFRSGVKSLFMHFLEVLKDKSAENWLVGYEIGTWSQKTFKVSFRNICEVKILAENVDRELSSRIDWD